MTSLLAGRGAVVVGGSRGMRMSPVKSLLPQAVSWARFPKASPGLIGYRDYHDAPPWLVDEISALLDGGAA